MRKVKPKKKRKKDEITKTGTLYIRDLPEGLKNRFRSICILRGESMTRIVELLLRTYIKAEGDPSAIRGLAE